MALTTEDIRTYAKDSAELNVLLEGDYQSSEELLALCVRLSVDDYNAVSPKSTYGVDDFPSDTILLYEVLHHLANSEAERQLRNQITYNAQGLNAGIDDKFPQYNQLAQYYKSLFEQKIREYKMFSNAEQAWGGSFSPYAGLNTFQYRS